MQESWDALESTHLGPRGAALRSSPFCTVLLARDAGPGPGCGVVCRAGGGTQVPEEMDIRDQVKTRSALPWASFCCPHMPPKRPAESAQLWQRRS